jgi:pyridoxine 5-phosphate synthase
MNLECAVTPEMIEIACQVKPHDVCLVPEKRQEVTTEGGLDVIGNFDNIKKSTQRLLQAGITVSIFIDPDEQQISKAKEAGATVIELHTGKYADTAGSEQAKELERIKAAAKFGHAIGLKVNAGHGLHEGNVEAIAEILEIAELNIGHAIVAEAVFKGWKAAIQDMRTLMLNARQHAMNQKH